MLQLTDMIPGVVLAAGRSLRMGRPKALLTLGSHSFINTIITTLHEASLEDVLVVTGADHALINQEVATINPVVRVVRNMNYEKGQLSSLITALRLVDRPAVRAVLVTLVDVPFFSAKTVQQLLDSYRETGAPIVRPARGDRHGHPVIFDRTLFVALRQADPREGAKAVIESVRSEVLNVQIDDDGAFFDVDTPADYEHAVRLFARGIAT